MKDTLAVIALLSPFVILGLIGDASKKEQMRIQEEKQREVYAKKATTEFVRKLKYTTPSVKMSAPVIPPMVSLPADWRSTLTTPARNVQLEAEMLSLETRPRPSCQPRSFTPPTLPTPNAAPVPIQKDLEIEERGAFWFGSDGSSGHIRLRPGGSKVYER